MKEVHSKKNIESFREKHYKDFDTFSFLQNSKNKRSYTLLLLKHWKRCVFKLPSFWKMQNKRFVIFSFFTKFKKQAFWHFFKMKEVWKRIFFNVLKVIKYKNACSLSFVKTKMCQNACFVFFKMKEVHSKKNIESFRQNPYKDFDTFSFLQNSKNKRSYTLLLLKHWKRCAFKLPSF